MKSGSGLKSGWLLLFLIVGTPKTYLQVRRNTNIQTTCDKPYKWQSYSGVSSVWLGLVGVNQVHTSGVNFMIKMGMQRMNRKTKNQEYRNEKRWKQRLLEKRQKYLKPHPLWPRRRARQHLPLGGTDGRRILFWAPGSACSHPDRNTVHRPFQKRWSL